MICASCLVELPGATESLCSACGKPALLARAEGEGDRYRLEVRIGEGGSGVTYRARRMSDDAMVCVKELPVRRLGGSFKAADLFHREAATLRQLEHDRIPRYLDDFVAGEGKSTALVLVQELVDGHNLAQEMADRRYSENAVIAMCAEILEILAYLHRLSPPLVHRDIKPSNVMRRRSDERLVLIDFGSVKSALADEVVGGSTVAGTYGFMAPEQLHGRSSPASDLYGLGMLAVVLLSRRDPVDLIDADQRLAWKPYVNASPATTALLERWLVADPARRAADAAEERERALSVLAGVAGLPARPMATTQISGSEIALLRVLAVAVGLAVCIGIFAASSQPPALPHATVLDEPGVHTLAERVSGEPRFPGVHGYGCRVAIATEPSGAVVWLDGVLSTSTTPLEEEVSCEGEHALSVDKEGQMSVIRHFTFGTEETSKRIEIVLEADPPGKESARGNP